MSENLTRILFVEDDESIAQVAMMALEDLGSFTVKHCNSGQKALDVVIEFGPQLILMDVMMPNMNGPETLIILQQMPEVSDVPVVFMTAKVQTHEKKAYCDMGAVGVIPKPFDPVTLSDEVTAFWEQNAA